VLGTCLAAVAIAVSVGAGNGQDPESSAVPLGAAEFAGDLVQQYGFLLDASQRTAADQINRALREAESKFREAPDETTKGNATEARNKAASKLIALLNDLPCAIRMSLTEEHPRMDGDEPVSLPGDTGALLFYLEAGSSPTRCVSMECDFSKGASSFTVDVGSSGAAWALVGLRNVPDRRTSFVLELRWQGGPSRILPVQVRTAPKGRLKVRVFSADGSGPVPAMVRLVWKTDGVDRRPSNAIEFAPQFGRHGTAGRRNALLPGRLRGAYWCVPGPFDMAVPPGEWEIVVRRGLEHIPVFDSFTVASGGVAEKTYQPRRWVDMRTRGWYSGDDHIHCRILSDADAERLMA